MNLVLFDNGERKKLYPLTNACAVADLRCGIFTSAERWSHITKSKVYIHTEEHLSVLYEPVPVGTNVWIDANLIPDERIIHLIFTLKENEAIVDKKGLVAGRKNFPDKTFSYLTALDTFTMVHELQDVKRLEYPWQVFQWNNELLLSDFGRLTAGRTSEKPGEDNRCIDPANLFIEQGAQVNASIINAATGPVYIGRNAVVMEGCVLRGPVALCEGSVLKMGAKVYGASTIGISGVGGGEIKNAVIGDYSNKAHDGYLGDSVIGRWCNLGAGTSNSNLKNTAGLVRMWNNFIKEYSTVDVKCGVVMGDYSRTAINSSLNTGTIIGTCCNIFGNGLLPTYIGDFKWGTNGMTYKIENALKDISNWKRMKGQQLSEEEVIVLKHIFEAALNDY